MLSKILSMLPCDTDRNRGRCGVSKVGYFALVLFKTRSLVLLSQSSRDDDSIKAALNYNFHLPKDDTKRNLANH